MNVTMKRIAILLLLMVSIFTAVADSPVSLYEKWKNKPAKELMNMGIKFDCSLSADSALVCYSIVADRLRDSSSSNDDKKILGEIEDIESIVSGGIAEDAEELSVMDGEGQMQMEI